MLDNGYRVDVEAVQGAPDLGAGRLRRPTAAADARTVAAADRPRGHPGPDADAHPHRDRPAVPAGAAAGRALAAAARRRHRTAHFVLWDLGATPARQCLAGRLGRRTAAAAAVRRGRPAHHLARLVDLPGPLGPLGLDAGSRVDGALLDAVQQIDTTDNGVGDGQVPVGHRRGAGVVPGAPPCRRRPSPRGRSPPSGPAGC